MIVEQCEWDRPCILSPEVQQQHNVVEYIEPITKQVILLWTLLKCAKKKEEKNQKIC